MKKLLNFIIEQTPKFKQLKTAYYDLDYRFNNLIDKKILIGQQNLELKKELGMLESRNIVLEKAIKKIRANANKLDRKNECVKTIKKIIKEVL